MKTTGRRMEIILFIIVYLGVGNVYSKKKYCEKFSAQTSTNDNPYRIDVEKPGIELQEHATKNIKESSDTFNVAQKKFNDFIKKNNELNLENNPNKALFLLAFLRATKFNYISAFELMKAVSNFKKNNCEVLKGLSVFSVKESLTNTNIINILTNRDQCGRRVLIVHLKNWKLENTPVDQFFKLFYITYLAALSEPITQINGAAVIVDFNGSPVEPFQNLSFDFNFIKFISNGMALRIEEIHIINLPKALKVLWYISIRNVVSDTLNKKLFFHDDVTEIPDYIERDCLPEDYGGNKPEIDYTNISKKWYDPLLSINHEINKWLEFGYQC